MKKIIKIAIFCFALTICSSCCLYKMPSDDTYGLIPKTNNPAYIKDDRAQMSTPNQASF